MALPARNPLFLVCRSEDGNLFRRQEAALSSSLEFKLFLGRVVTHTMNDLDPRIPATPFSSAGMLLAEGTNEMAQTACFPFASSPHFLTFYPFHHLFIFCHLSLVRVFLLPVIVAIQGKKVQIKHNGMFLVLQTNSPASTVSYVSRKPAPVPPS